jgi:hypothetical protein
MACESQNFCAWSVFFAKTGVFRWETPDFLDFRALSPFSELGFSLTLALWFTQSGTLIRRRQTCQRMPVAKLMNKAPRKLLLPAHIIVRRHA